MDELFCDDDDDGVEDIIIQAIMAHVEDIFELRKQERMFKAYNKSERVDWAAHVALKLHRNEFHTTYRMQYNTFVQLVDILRPDISINTVKALNSAPHMEPIYPELVCAVGLKFLAGGRTADIADWAGISQSSYHRIKMQFVEAVLKTPQLAIKFPSTREECEEAAQKFARMSNRGGVPIFQGCVGAIDGMIARIYQPKDVPDQEQRAYYSGHYECFGLNVQAVCDNHCRFIYIATAAPGSTPDISAIKEIDIERLIENLPAGFYLLGDAAYPVSEKLLIPYTHGSRLDNGNDVFNYFLSQLRIRIEMTFGLLTTKFRIFRVPMDMKLENTSKVIEVCARLHNFIIDVQRPDVSQEATQIDRYEGVPGLVEEEQLAGYVPAQPRDDDDLAVHLDPDTNYHTINVPGTSSMRQAIRDFVVAQGLQRPGRNTARRAQEEEDRVE